MSSLENKSLLLDYVFLKTHICAGSWEFIDFNTGAEESPPQWHQLIWFSCWCQCDDLHVSVRRSNLNKLLLGTLFCSVFLKCRLTHQRWNKTSHKCCRTRICSCPLCFDRSNKVTGRNGPHRTSAGWSNNWVLEIASTLGCCVHKNTTALLMLQGNPARITHLLLGFVAKIIHLDKKIQQNKKIYF